MQFTPNVDVAKWLDNMRGNLSRQAYITLILRKEMATMNETPTTEGINDKTSNIYGATDAPSQI